MFVVGMFDAEDDSAVFDDFAMNGAKRAVSTKLQRFTMLCSSKMQLTDYQPSYLSDSLEIKHP